MKICMMDPDSGRILYRSEAFSVLQHVMWPVPTWAAWARWTRCGSLPSLSRTQSTRKQSPWLGFRKGVEISRFVRISLTHSDYGAVPGPNIALIQAPGWPGITAPPLPTCGTCSKTFCCTTYSQNSEEEISPKLVQDEKFVILYVRGARAATRAGIRVCEHPGSPDAATTRFRDTVRRCSCTISTELGFIQETVVRMEIWRMPSGKKKHLRWRAAWRLTVDDRLLDTSNVIVLFSPNVAECFWKHLFERHQLSSQQEC
jgi:hypothetical protein